MAFINCWFDLFGAQHALIAKTFAAMLKKRSILLNSLNRRFKKKKAAKESSSSVFDKLNFRKLSVNSQTNPVFRFCSRPHPVPIPLQP